MKFFPYVLAPSILALIACTQVGGGDTDETSTSKLALTGDATDPTDPPDGVQNSIETDPGPGTPSSHTYAQLYFTPDGETHWRDITLTMTMSVVAPPAQPVGATPTKPATGWRFIGFKPHWGVSDRDNMLFHQASGVRFITVVQGICSIMASDGEVRQFHPGDVMEVLDGPGTIAKGHITWFEGEPGLLFYTNHN